MKPDESISDMQKSTSRFDEWWDTSRFPAIGLVLIGFALAVWAYYDHFSPGKSIGALAAVAGVMSLRPNMKFGEKVAWMAILTSLAMLEFRSINVADIENLEARREVNTKLQEVLKGIETDTKQLNVISIGIASMAQKSSPETHSVQRPQENVQQGQSKRFISAEKLGLDLQGKETSSATVINDGTNEAGNLANQLVIGLRDANWVAGGNNIKMGDPAFFPDSLTVEVSSRPASADDRSVAEAKSLVSALAKQSVTATLRYTDQAFPANFMRVKVAGQ
jgi:hypothetical protein